MSLKEYYEEYAIKMPIEKKITLGTKKRFEFILKHLTEPILDVGCSKGYDLKNIYKEGFRKLEGTDISQKAIKEAIKENGKFAKFFVHNFEKKSMKKKYKTVICFDVIEHVFDTTSFLKNIFNVVNKKGKLIITCPNVFGIKNRINFVLGKDKEHFIPKKDNPHIRFFSFETISRKLKETGFEKIETWKDSKIPFLPTNLCGSITIIAYKEK
ncbi:MAG: class I SAM-dependent methyltransferase [Candidatus Diapherotrites archaeon]|nr:class I SAM-dependent methyltransferase [Candidatus Diapherotrites archaeon]